MSVPELKGYVAVTSRPDVKTIVQTPSGQPEMSNTITSLSLVDFAAATASRRLPGPLSFVLVTVYVAASPDSAVTDDPTMNKTVSRKMYLMFIDFYLPNLGDPRSP